MYSERDSVRPAEPRGITPVRARLASPWTTSVLPYTTLPLLSSPQLRDGILPSAETVLPTFHESSISSASNHLSPSRPSHHNCASYAVKLLRKNEHSTHRIATASQYSLSHASIHESGQKTAAINFQTETSIIVGLLKLRTVSPPH